MTRRFLKRASPPTLTLDNFPHLSSDTEMLRSFLKNAVEKKEVGVNILFHSKPGVGKTEYVQSLAAALGLDLYDYDVTTQSVTISTIHSVKGFDYALNSGDALFN